jgi:biopolymer transport protein TolR
MAFKIDDEELGTLSDINVVPLVDVMLVLLIVFMITAPLLTQGLMVELPPAEGQAFEEAPVKSATVTVTTAGEVFVDGDSVGSDQLEVTLGSALRGRRISQALLEADHTVTYGRVVEVIDIMNRAGVEQLGMVTRPREAAVAGRSR